MRALTPIPSRFLALGFSLIPALALAQPACSPYIFSYNNAADLDSQTSILFSSMSLCSGASSAPTTTGLAAITSTSIGAAATSSTPPLADPCDYSTDPAQLKNAGFECGDVSNFKWNLVQAIQVSDPEFAHEGSSFLSMSSSGGASSVTQLITEQDQDVVTVTFWARLMSGHENLAGCQLRVAKDDGAEPTVVDLYPGTTPTTDWTMFSYQFTGNGFSVDFSIQWGPCIQGTNLYVDDFNVSLVSPSPIIG